MKNWNNINNNTEQLLQKEAEKYSVHPSDKVWENIRVELHGKPKWKALPLIFISIVLSLTIATIINYPPQKFLIKNLDPVLSHTKSIISIPSNKTKRTIQTLIEKLKDKTDDKFEFTNIGLDNNATALSNKNIKNTEEVITITTPIKNNDIQATETYNNVSTNNLETSVETFANPLKENSKDFALNAEPQNVVNDIKFKNDEKTLCSDDVNNYLKTFDKKSLVKQDKKSKWKVQYYATISNSYRTLEDDKSRLSFLSNSSERKALKGNVNDVVKHKPAVGGEFGVSFLYKLTKNLHLKSGLQFNVRQYGIDAYRANGNATFSYLENNKLSSIQIKSAFTTEQGAYSARLENQLYQLSIPIGLQWDVINGERWGLSTAATIQPTVTLNEDVYVVSTDYKYYADGTSFFRRFNINTSTELYLTLKSKNVKWFFGPQIRYQQLPTYNDIYPIKEYRVDYGIKFGFIKSF